MAEETWAVTPARLSHLATLPSLSPRHNEAAGRHYTGATESSSTDSGDDDSQGFPFPV